MKISLGILDQLATDLVELDSVRSASTDPAKVNALPGVWVRFTGLPLDLLGGYTINASLVVLVDDTDHTRSRTTLLDVAGDVLDLVDAAGDLVPQPTVLPSGPKILPGLAIPISLASTFDTGDAP